MQMDKQALQVFVHEQFPQAAQTGLEVAYADAKGVTLHFEAGQAHLRPGGTVSGPVLMMLADTAVYLAILAQVGPVALAVTSSLEIHFLRKAFPGPLDVRADVRSLGRKLAVGSFTIHAAGEEIAFGSATYAFPSSMHTAQGREA